MLKRKFYNSGLVIYCSLIIIAGSIQQESFEEMTLSAKTDTVISESPVFILPDVILNPPALLYAQDYLKKNNWGLSQLKKRSKANLAIINSVFSKYDLPTELKYMAVVESNLNATSVCNSSGATGIWQLMPFTADELGLTVSYDNDERLHIQKSSAAVAKYLKQLYAEFGDWLLVIAAYNSGPAKVSRAVELSGTHDFWKLQQYLPAETRNHVKRYISIVYYFEMQQNPTVRDKMKPATSS